MGIREVQIDVGGMPHTVQVNDDDKGAAPLGEKIDARAKSPSKPSAKATTPRNKAVKPTANKTAAATAIEDASDPDASE